MQLRYKTERVKASKLGVRMRNETPRLTLEQLHTFQSHILWLPELQCPIWQGTRNWSGLGLFEIAGQLHYAHKIAWQEANDCVGPEGLFIGKTCGNAPCMDIKHLKLLDSEDYKAFLRQNPVKKPFGRRRNVS